jgi:hypothetical protein
MVETVNPEEFVTQQQKKKVEDYEFVKVRLSGGVAHMTLKRPDHSAGFRVQGFLRRY